MSCRALLWVLGMILNACNLQQMTDGILIVTYLTSGSDNDRWVFPKLHKRFPFGDTTVRFESTSAPSCDAESLGNTVSGEAADHGSLERLTNDAVGAPISVMMSSMA